jgi:hypothetical protein
MKDDVTTAPVSKSAKMGTSLDRKPAEHWAIQKGVAAWQFAGAKYGERWPTGQEITEQEFDAAMARAASVEVR